MSTKRLVTLGMTIGTAFVGAIGATAAAAALHVPGDFAAIQACIDAAVSGVDECVVAPGTYHETINFLGKAITVRSSGGADVTTIDATGVGGSVVTCVSGEGPDTVLDGFTITGGTGTDAGGYTLGGGMYNHYSSPTVINCTFSGNTADYGGGIYNYDSSPTVAGCTFSGNTSPYGAGGGMYNYRGSSAWVAHCTFSGNTAVAGGAGICNYDSSPTVIACTFSGNTSPYGAGGGMYNAYGSPVVTNSTFSGNTANDGGGMFSSRSRATVTNCMFSENTAGNKGTQASGGGMSNYVSNPIVTHCSFNRNFAAYGGGMCNTRGSNPMVTNSAFSGNTASVSGGGMQNNGSSPTAVNCVFGGNGAGYGGAMYTRSGTPIVTSCTFIGNSAFSAGGAMLNDPKGSPTLTNCILWGDNPDEIANFDTPAHTVRFSDVRGGLPVGTVDGGGNFDLDPMFVRLPNPGPDGTWGGVDDDYGDLRLQAGSPCIDTGDPAFVAQPGETDLEGHARVLCGRVDMGAYEFGIGDYDCDQVVDLADFSSWQACMTGPLDSAAFHSTIDTCPEPRRNRQSTIGCESFDIDGDGNVSLFDFSGFQRIFAP